MAARLHARGGLDRMWQAPADGAVDVDTPALESIAERLRRLLATAI